MDKQEIKEKITKLKKQIRYEKRRMQVCAYGSSDLRYLYGLESELADLEKQIGNKGGQ